MINGILFSPPQDLKEILPVTFRQRRSKANQSDASLHRAIRLPFAMWRPPGALILQPDMQRWTRTCTRDPARPLEGDEMEGGARIYPPGQVMDQGLTLLGARTSPVLQMRSPRQNSHLHGELNSLPGCRVGIQRPSRAQRLFPLLFV